MVSTDLALHRRPLTRLARENLWNNVPRLRVMPDVISHAEGSGCSSTLIPVPSRPWPLDTVCIIPIDRQASRRAPTNSFPGSGNSN